MKLKLNLKEATELLHDLEQVKHPLPKTRFLKACLKEYTEN